jgi:hypothetical protein
MRTGAYQRKGAPAGNDGGGTTQAMRNAEALFESRGVAEIRQVGPSSHRQGQVHPSGIEGESVEAPYLGGS